MIYLAVYGNLFLSLNLKNYDNLWLTYIHVILQLSYYTYKVEMADVQTPIEVAPAKIEEVVDEVVVTEETTTEAKVEEVVDNAVVTEEKQVILCYF